MASSDTSAFANTAPLSLFILFPAERECLRVCESVYVFVCWAVLPHVCMRVLDWCVSIDRNRRPLKSLVTYYYLVYHQGAYMPHEYSIRL